jgi:ketosteroid isomerase-like protein
VSRENVEIVRRGVDSFNRRDIAAFLTDFDQNAEWVEDQRFPGAETFHGPSGVERSVRKWWDAWGEIATDLRETIDLGTAWSWPVACRHVAMTATSPSRLRSAGSTNSVQARWSVS